TDVTSIGFRDRHADLLAHEQLFDRLRQIVVLRSRTPHGNGQLVVDPALVTDGSLLIQQEHFGSSNRAEAVGDEVARILQNGKRYLVRLNEFGKFSWRVLLIRIDADDLQSARFEFSRQ